MNYVKKLAQLIIDYSLDVKSGQLIAINGSTIAEPLIKELYKEILIRGAYPIPQVSIEGLSNIFYKYANEQQIKFITPTSFALANNLNGKINIDCEFNTKELSNVDASKIAMFAKHRQPLDDIYDFREEKGEFKWIVCPYPSLASAQDAEMSLEEYSDFVFNSCGLNEKSPSIYWEDKSQIQKTFLDRLIGTKEITIKHGDDTSLKMNVEGRKFISCDGKLNMPDGEIYTSPIENSVNGCIYFDYPACYNGVEVEGVFLQIKDGIIIDAKAKKNEEFLHKMLDADDGSRYIGEFAFGLNYDIQKHTKNILFDEKIGGTIHLAIGASYPDAGGKNKSGIHWDIVKEMKNGGEVYADNKLIYKNGKF